MSKSLHIRPLLIAAIFFALIGSLLGGVMSFRAVTTLTESTNKIGQFERQWSNAEILDIRCSQAAKYYVTTLDPEALTSFNMLVEKRPEALLGAVDAAPHLKQQEALQQTYDAALKMSDIESAAVSLVQTGDQKAGIMMLKSPRYGQLSSAKSRLKEKARHELLGAISSSIYVSDVLLFCGLAALFIGLMAAAYFWFRIGKIFQLQNKELETAHTQLARHANELESRIEARTKDLEAAKIAAEAADKAKSAFLAQMSHEIRTPLNGVLGMASALSRTKMDERQRRLLEVIQESGDTLLAILNDVLDLAKIEAGKIDLEEIQFSVRDIVNSSEAMFSTRAHDKGLSFSVTIDKSADVWCTGDPTRLRQIIYNLTSNAIKFTEEGEVRVEVGTTKSGEGVIGLQFRVRDTGVGMDEDGISRLFQRFSQADSTTTRKYGGTGLGLAICKQLAQMMNGDIRVESQIGKGSTFILDLDLQITNAPAETTAEALENSITKEEENGSDLRILAAEDNANNRLVLKMLLEQVGVEPTFVENGALAVEAWKNGNFDVILMDIQMPIMSGPEATKHIRDLEKTTGRRRTPIIALTANAMTHHVRECMSVGMDHHVAKPIRPDLLFAAIDKVLSEAPTQASEVTAAS